MIEIAKERIELPSKGYPYPPENPLSQGFVEMRYMTSKDEDMLTNPNNRKNGIIGLIEILLKSLIVTEGVNVDDLLEGDREQLVVAARILSYGSQYTFDRKSVFDDKTIVPQTVDLSKLKDVELDTTIIKKGKTVYEYTLPVSGTKIEFKFLTHKDLKEIYEQSVVNYDLYKNVFAITTRLKKQLVSVNGDTSLATINKFSENMLAGDSKEFRKYYKKICPDLIKTYTYVENEYIEEGVDFDFNYIELFFRD